MALQTIEVPLATGRLCVDVDVRWADEAQSLLAHLAGLPREQLPELKIDTGWAVLSVSPGEDPAGLYLVGPSFDDPQQLTNDLTPHFEAMVTQARTIAQLGVDPQPIRFDEDVSVELEALTGEEIYIKRTGWPEDASGWHLGPLTAEASDHIHLDRIPAHKVVAKFPATLAYLSLPDNFLIGIVSGQVDAVFSPEGTQVMGPGGTPLIQAHPELVTAAATELAISKPEAVAYSQHHPTFGYFLVRRDDPAAMVGVHPNGEQLRVQGRRSPEEFAQLWALGDRTPPGYALD